MGGPEIKRIPIGKKIERIRELRGMKQDALAIALGVSQQAISKMEQSDDIDDEKLEKVAIVLGVTKEAIKNFSEDNAIYNIQNNYDSASYNVNYQESGMEKVIELYELLLANEREKIALLEKLLKEKVPL